MKSQMLRRVAVVAVASLSPVWASALTSGSDLNCDADAFKEYSWEKSDLSESLSILDIVNESNFSSMKKDASGNVTIPIYGVPVNFGATYSSFDTTRNELFKQYSFQSNKISSREYVHYRFSGESTAAYGACVQGKIDLSKGLHLVISNATERTFNVSVVNNTGGTRALPSEVEVKSGKTSKITKIAGGIAPGSRFPLNSFTRDPEADLTISLKMGFPVVDGDTAFIPATPKSSPPMKELSCFGRHDIEVYNNLYDSRLQQRFPSLYSGSPGTDGIALGLASNHYYYAAGGGRDWIFDVGTWGVPAGATIADASVSAKGLNMTNSDQFDVKASKLTGRTINVHAQSSFGASVSQYEISYSVNVKASDCPHIY